jgi:hypothetical protein
MKGGRATKESTEINLENVTNNLLLSMSNNEALLTRYNYVKSISEKIANQSKD